MSNESQISETPSLTGEKPKVVGLYGVSGCGKSSLLQQLKAELGKDFSFTDGNGSQVFADLLPGRLDAFQAESEIMRATWRQTTIELIGKRCAESGRTAVVAGHGTFYSKKRHVILPQVTDEAKKICTHVLYLGVTAEEIWQRRQKDTVNKRRDFSIRQLSDWQQAEKTELRCICRQHGILFSVVPSGHETLQRAADLLRDFHNRTEEWNLSRAKRRMDEILANHSGRLQTLLVIDADRTLAPQDTGSVFWQILQRVRQQPIKDRLEIFYRGPMKYSYLSFRQAVLLCEEFANDEQFDTICEEVAKEVSMHPEFECLLKKVKETEYVGAVVVTYGLRHVWEKVLKYKGLDGTVGVVGGGRIADGFVVTAAVKGFLINHLREVHKAYVWAFGDSQLDIEMLMNANEAIIVTSDERTRSTTMDAALGTAIDDGLMARQVLLPSHVMPRLDAVKLPVIKLSDPEFVKSVLGPPPRQGGLRILVASDENENAADLLTIPIRNTELHGPSLREAYRRVGQHLATNFLADEVGLVRFSMKHVVGGQNCTEGVHLKDEYQTLIVAIMRGGEPMALGISEVFPRTIFVHAKDPDDVEPYHVQGIATVILVDSEVNTGKTIVKFAVHIRALQKNIRILVVAGIVQYKSIIKGSPMEILSRRSGFTLITLRCSNMKYTGSGTTDTGNRLFNTTHLP